MAGWRSLLIALAAVLWSTDALFRQPLTASLSALAIVFSEHLLALVFVLPLLWGGWQTIKKLSARQWLAVFFIGIAASALATVAFTASFSYVSPSVSILLQKIQPLFTWLLAFLILEERLPRHFWWWVVVALGAAYVISFPELTPQLTLYQAGTKGIILALIAALLWGSATVFGRWLLKDIAHPLVTALRFIVALPALAAMLYVSGGGFNWLGELASWQWWYLIIIMLGPGFGAMYFYYRGLAVTKATVTAVLELTWPLAAVVLNWIFLKETLTALQIIGGLVLIAAIARLTVWRFPKEPSVSATIDPTRYDSVPG